MNLHLSILNLSFGATVEEIKSARNKLALRWHPDRNRNNVEEATEMMKKINAAHDYLIENIGTPRAVPVQPKNASARWAEPMQPPRPPPPQPPPTPPPEDPRIKRMAFETKITNIFNDSKAGATSAPHNANMKAFKAFVKQFNKLDGIISALSPNIKNDIMNDVNGLALVMFIFEKIKEITADVNSKFNAAWLWELKENRITLEIQKALCNSTIRPKSHSKLDVEGKAKTSLIKDILKLIHTLEDL